LINYCEKIIMFKLGTRSRVSRRDFIRQIGVTSASVAFGCLTKGAFAQTTPDVVVAHGGTIDDRIKAALEPLGGIERFVIPGQTVVIKPNAAFAEAPNRGSNTTPEVVRGVVRICNKVGARKVIVVEHCLSNSGRFGTSYDVSGVSQAAIAEGAELVDTGTDAKYYHQFRLTTPFQENYTITRLLFEADVVINLPRLKEHPFAGYTMSMKNLMGVMQYPAVIHRDDWRKLPERLSRLGRALQPHITLNIIDGTDIVENWAAGQRKARLTRIDTIIAGKNMVTTDAIGMTFFGLNPLDDWKCATGDNYIRLSHRAGWGNADLKTIRVKEVSV
jgi:uncharacterized protein (DUF362 family)